DRTRRLPQPHGECFPTGAVLRRTPRVRGGHTPRGSFEFRERAGGPKHCPFMGLQLQQCSPLPWHVACFRGSRFWEQLLHTQFLGGLVMWRAATRFSFAAVVGAAVGLVLVLDAQGQPAPASGPT